MGRVGFIDCVADLIGCVVGLIGCVVGLIGYVGIWIDFS
jgi:hypothetical protein